MRDSKRATIAAVAFASKNNTRVSSVFDRERATKKAVSVDILNGKVTGYDHEEKCRISGDESRIFHHGERRFIRMGVTGYDSGDRQYFRVNVHKKGVRIFDHVTGKDYYYRVV